VRGHLEALLREKKLDRTLAAGAGFLSRDEREERLLASGWASVDRALGGGFPRGECSEIVGSSSSGRTALLTTLLAEATRCGEIVALVDTLDRFDPRAAVENTSLDLSRLLWVRGASLSPQALSAQAQAETRARRRSRAQAGSRQTPARMRQARPLRWLESDEEAGELVDRVVERALKSFGLIAQAGGFGVVALDFADVPMTALRRLPFTTWFRLQRLIEGRPSVGLVLAPEPVGRSARGVTVRLGTKEATRVIWAGTHDCARVLAGFALQPQTHAARRLGDQRRESVLLHAGVAAPASRTA
jgi:hypothetical protein